MKNSLLVTLFLVFAVSFMVGSFSTPAQAKILNCWTSCEYGVLYQCCEVTRGKYLLLHWRALISQTPC